ncbi:MAG: MFS transporter [Actinomycetota bacterium]|nr:MFS transporter [Actinomycetota bacterium]
MIVLTSTFVTHQLFDDNTTRAAPFLFALILLIQFVAVGGSLSAERLTRRFAARRVLMASLVVWCAVIAFAYLALRDKTEAVLAGVVIGVALGATTALSRGLFVSMIPAGREATWFSLYEVCSQGTSWIAPLLFTVVVNTTGSFRQALLSLILLFAAGLVVLAKTDTDQAASEAARQGPDWGMPARDGAP